jgi:uncharacterized protein YegL
MGFMPESQRPPIEELNDGFELFCQELSKDDIARKRVEVEVITFGDVAQVAMDFQEARDLAPRRFQAVGGTPMGAALNLAADELDRQKAAYKSSDLNYFCPWLFVLTDGQPTDGDVFTSAAKRVADLEAENHLNVFPIGIGDRADMQSLALISRRRSPVKLRGLSFKEFFIWLSNSLGTASRSKEPDRGEDGEPVRSGEQVALPPPADWMQVSM